MSGRPSDLVAGLGRLDSTGIVSANTGLTPRPAPMALANGASAGRLQATPLCADFGRGEGSGRSEAAP